MRPGTTEAIRAGCLCPVMDNGYGRGWRYVPGRESSYIYSSKCPIHGGLVAAAAAMTKDAGDD